MSISDFIASNDNESAQTVKTVWTNAGISAIHAGPLSNSRKLAEMVSLLEDIKQFNNYKTAYWSIQH
jgi:predicted dinucleotide-binding enzyme